MSTTEEVLTQLSRLLERINSPQEKGNAIGAFLKNPIVITVVGSLLVTAGTNWVTKQFQLRDKQSDAIAALEAEIPRELALTGHLARVSSVLEEEKCSENPEKKLSSPFVMGLTGKSCKEAEAEYLKYYTLFLEHPPGSSLVRIRALFASPAIDDGAKKLGALVDLLSITSQSACIVRISKQAHEAYEELVDLSIREIDGSHVEQESSVFQLRDLAAHCKAEDLCRVPAIAKDSSLMLACE